MEHLFKIVTGIIRRNSRRKWMRAGVMSAACIVVFVTTYALILPAITISLDQASEMPGFDSAFNGELLGSDEDFDGEAFPGDKDDAQGNEDSPEDLFSDDGDEIIFGGGAAEGIIAGFGSDINSETETTSEGESITENETSAETENISEDNAVTEEETESITDKENAEQVLQLTYEGEDYTIRLTGGADAKLPKDAYLAVREIEKDSDEYQMYLAASGAALQRENENAEETVSGETAGSRVDVEARFFDITIMSGGEVIEPEGTVSVDISYHDALPLPADSEIGVVHFEDGEETATVLEADPQTEDGVISSVSFDTDSFSVFGIIYTVDLHYDVDGREFTASIPGGGYVSIRELVETLGIPVSFDGRYSTAAQTESTPEGAGESSKAAGLLVQEIENITFSSPELLHVSKAEADTTVGAIRENFGLDCEYSADLTEDEIQQINGAEISAGDWVLISLRPFETEETLTVTMKNGDVFTVLVTDAQLKKTVISASGEAYEITVTYDSSTGIPEDAELEAEEILPAGQDGSDGLSSYGMSYEEYVAYTENAMGMDAGSAGYIRLFDIRIVDKDDSSIKYQPAEGTSVNVKIELADAEGGSLSVVHFADEAETGAVLQNTTESSGEGQAVLFAADGFSVYSIVDAPSPAHFGPYNLSSLEEIEENKAYLLSYGSTKKYFTSEVNGSGCLIENTDSSAAAEWYFEKADEDGNTFYIHTFVNGNKKYIHQKDSGKNPIELADIGTAFVLSEATDKPGTFIFMHSSEERWLQHSNGGQGIRFYDKDDKTNARIYITNKNAEESQNDPYKLSGQTFGIAYNNNSTVAAAVSANGKTVSGQSRLEGTDMLIRADVLNNKGVLLVAENSDIQEWTFESIEKDKYYIKTTVDGAEKYLNINNGNVTLVDNRDDASEIQAIPGTGASKGKWHFTVNNYSLNYTGSAANGFNAANNSNATTWLNLVERSTLTEDDFTYYSARKISASDDLLGADAEEKAKVIVYTRVWNNDTSRYDYYAVDHDGSLVRVYDSGDKINWVGNQVNSTLWEFTEYTNADGTPNNYYELENTAYSNTFLAPQSSGVIVDHKVGVNMEGRQEGLDYTNILAWDEAAYAYSGLKVEGNKVVPCPKDEADDFYFAVLVPPVQAADPVTTVETVDNNEYGISMRMIDFNNRFIYDGTSPRDSVQHPFFGGHAYDQNTPDKGLLSTNLTNGYPITTASTSYAGRSLAELYNQMTPANHLFIQSVYNESGYFEYDSTQNFAHYDGSNFTVYNQLGAIGTSTGDTRTHGQFMPYNDISAETGYAYDTQGRLITNKTDVLRNELPDSDPRKGEPLYSIPQNDADYFFGMELSAAFTQTPSGLDNWGHDIIFEFTGDDDFWLYVDGELVLDLGGIHSAMPGSVNFRTGEVIVNKTRTSLYEIFRSNYQKRGMSENEISAKLGEIFEEKEVNGKTVHVFRDYSKHTMKMFYMERGAGASNLKMRFNLASVQPGTVELSKKLAGTRATSNKLIQYPYQIWYRMPNYKTENNTIVHDEYGNPVIESYGEPVRMVQGATPSAAVAVLYKGAKKLVPFRESLDIGGTEYKDVFLLKAGETAVIRFPDQNCIYEIIECGVDTEVYEQVSVNGEELTGTLYNNTDTGAAVAAAEEDRKDFGISYETTGSRPRAEYSNKVTPDVMRTLAFKKVVYDTEGKEIKNKDLEKVTGKFSFRLYLGNEFADQNNLSPASMYSYYVKDPKGYYCRWNAADQCFERIGKIKKFEGHGGLAEYLNSASSAGKSAIVFTTSLNGSISNIPAGYTVEVRDLIVGTKYKVDEPDREIPKGYTRRDGDGYVRTDLDGGDVVYYTEEGNYGRHLEEGNKITAEPISDTIVSKTESPEIEVRNQEGWGLTAEKEWTDKDFMIHDPIYLAVYLDKGSGSSPELVGGSVRRLNTGETEVYWFFPDLKINDEPYSFSQFIVREVVLEGTPSVHESTGVVTGYSGITPIGKNESVSVSGRTISGDAREETYTVIYQLGDSTGQNVNIRTDTITNSRPGIQIYKKDWSGENFLSGAVFTLKDSNGKDVGAASYTSDSKGLVTTAYLNEGTFTLNEIRTPAGYAALDEPITITVTKTEPGTYDLTVPVGNTTYYITLSGPEGFYTTAEATEQSMARITVKNRTVQDLTVVKEGVDGDTRIRLGGVHFALYDQVKDSEGNLRPAYNPKSGYEDLVSDENGVLRGLTMSVGKGTYYLREKAAPSGFKKLAEDLCFTIGEDGTVTIHNSGYSNWLTRDTTVLGNVSYQISIENAPLGITVRKTDDSGDPLTGARFELSRKNDTGVFKNVTGYGLGENGLIDLADKPEMTFKGLQSGNYKLTETYAPSGYIILTRDIYFSVSDGAVALTKEDGSAGTYSDVLLLDDNTTIAVRNNPGASLPDAGGSGTHHLTLLGAALMALAGTVTVLRRKDRNRTGN